MKLRDVEYLLALDRERNITRAAKYLGISQSTLSYFLSKYEEEVGARLFYRHPTQLMLTEAGRLHIEAARQMANIKAHTYHAIRTLGKDVNYTTLTIGVTPNRGQQIVTRIYPQFIDAFPNVRIKTVEGYSETLERGLLSGKIDIMLSSMMIEQMDERIEFIKMRREEIVLAMHKSFPLASKGIDMPDHSFPVILKEELADTPIIMMQEGTTVRWLVDRYLANTGIKPLVVFETTNVKFASNLAAEGAGAAFLPLFFAKSMSNLRYFSLDPGCFLDLGVSYIKDRELLPAEEFFIELISKGEKEGSLFR